MGCPMTVRAAIFGISRSGKDYTIRDATELLTEKGMLFSHISPITMVQEELDGRKLSELSECEKRNVIEKVRGRMTDLLKDDYVFSDEHYCYPRTFGGRVLKNGYYGEKLPYYDKVGRDNRIYEVVFEDGWLDGYDLAIYLDIDPYIIMDRMRTSEGGKQNLYATYDDIHLWKMFEIEGIQRMCIEKNIPMYYVYDPKKSGEEVALIISEYVKRVSGGTKSKSINGIGD